MKIKITLTAAAFLALAACGGGETPTESPGGNRTETPPPPDTRDAGQILHAGDTLTPRNASKTLHILNQEGKTELIDPIDFTIKRTEAGEYVVTLGDRQHTFTRDQRTAPHEATAEYTDADNVENFMQFWVYADTRSNFHENLDNGHSEGHYNTVWLGRRDVNRPGPDDRLRTFGIFGNPTTTFNHLNDMTATYTGGWAWLSLFAADFEPRNFNSDEDQLKLYSYADGAKFTANFADQTISGQLTNFREWDTEKPFDLTLTMPKTKFGTDAIKGEFTASGNFLRNETVEYDASFWGPDANGLAGTISLSGEADDSESGRIPVVGIGHFTVDQDK